MGQYTETNEETNGTPQSGDFPKEDQNPELSKLVKSNYAKWSKSRSLFKEKTKTTKQPNIGTSSTLVSTIGVPAKKKSS